VVAVLAAAALAALFVASLVAAPIVEAADGPVIRSMFAPLCHQMPERSLAVVGRPMAVCARCTGLYLGGTIGLLLGGVLAAWRRPAPRALFFAAVLPTGLDWVAASAGLPALGNVARGLLALPAGIACGWYLAYGIGDWMTLRRHRARSAPASLTLR